LRDPDEQARELAAESLAGDDAVGWFERLYVSADQGEATVPWDVETPQQVLVDWAMQRQLDGRGRSALVVGCGLGRDAEFIAGLGFHTVAFDISPTAIRNAKRRHPESEVSYVVADLLDPPNDWHGAFDLVAESITVQSLPRRLRKEATAAVSAMVAPGGTLIVVSGVLGEDEDPDDGPPWPLTRAEIEAFSTADLAPARIEEIDGRWRAEFHREETR
jgi:SAM-dependent methyltransferase